MGRHPVRLSLASPCIALRVLALRLAGRVRDEVWAAAAARTDETSGETRDYVRYSCTDTAHEPYIVDVDYANAHPSPSDSS